MGHKKLGELLLSTGAINQTELRLAVRRHQLAGTRIGQALLDLGLADEKTLVKALAAQTNVDFVELSNWPLQADALKAIPTQMMKALWAVPLLIANGELLVATAPSNERRVATQCARVSGLKVRVVNAAPTDIAKALNRIFANSALPAQSNELVVDY